MHTYLGLIMAQPNVPKHTEDFSKQHTLSVRVCTCGGKRGVGGGGVHRANYRCHVSGWKVRFLVGFFLWKTRRAAAGGCGGILCGFTHLKPSGSCVCGPFSMIINGDGRGLGLRF